MSDEVDIDTESTDSTSSTLDNVLASHLHRELLSASWLSGCSSVEVTSLQHICQQANRKKD